MWQWNGVGTPWYNLSGRNITDASLCVGATTELRKIGGTKPLGSQPTYVAVAIPDSHFGPGMGTPSLEWKS